MFPTVFEFILTVDKGARPRSSAYVPEMIAAFILYLHSAGFAHARRRLQGLHHLRCFFRVQSLMNELDDVHIDALGSGQFQNAQVAVRDLNDTKILIQQYGGGRVALKGAFIECQFIGCRNIEDHQR